MILSYSWDDKLAYVVPLNIFLLFVLIQRDFAKCNHKYAMFLQMLPIAVFEVICIIEYIFVYL